jgi:hypothetical protein
MIRQGVGRPLGQAKTGPAEFKLFRPFASSCAGRRAPSTRAAPLTLGRHHRNGAARRSCKVWENVAGAGRSCGPSVFSKQRKISPKTISISNTFVDRYIYFMNDKVISLMRKEINDLKMEIVRMRGVINFESDDVTGHIKRINKFLNVLDDRSIKHFKFHNESIANLYDIVEPIEEKMFPGVSKARRQLAALVKKSEQDSGKGRGKTKP